MPARCPRRLSLALAAALSALAAACGGPDPPARADVVLIVVDTLRADRLGSHGNPRGLTPNLDRLAGRGALFEDASAHAPWTLPSFASLFTSQTPPAHGAGGGLTADLAPDFRALPAAAATLADAFRRAGYATSLVGNVAFLQPEFGLQRGFDAVDVVAFASNSEVRDARATTDAALAWFARAPAPRFLVVHYFDPHAMYAPPPEYRARFAAPEDRDGDFVFGTRSDLALLRRGQLALEPSVVRRAEKLYDGEVAFVDAEIGRLLGELGDAVRDGDAERFVVVTADHGEEFLEHGGFEHGHTLYQELLHVPLVVCGPGIEPRRVPTPVGLVDVAPTLLELVGLPVPESFRGRSLARALRTGSAVQGLGILAEGNMWGPARTSWRHAEWKLIRPATAAESTELYDLASDPGESENRARTAWERYDQLEDELTAVLASVRGFGSPGAEAQLSDEALESLRETGYLGGGDE